MPDFISAYFKLSSKGIKYQERLNNINLDIKYEYFSTHEQNFLGKKRDKEKEKIC